MSPFHHYAIGAFFALMHISIAASLVYGVLITDNLSHLMCIFIMVAALLMAFIQHGDCIMSSVEAHYLNGTSFLRTWMKHFFVDPKRIHAYAAFHVILAGLGLVMMKVVWVITRRSLQEDQDNKELMKQLLSALKRMEKLRTGN